jgi:hypothetical protein
LACALITLAGHLQDAELNQIILAVQNALFAALDSQVLTRPVLTDTVV